MPKLDGFFSSCKHAFSISLDLLYLYSTGVASTHISVYITIICHIHAYTMPKKTIKSNIGLNTSQVTHNVTDHKRCASVVKAKHTSFKSSCLNLTDAKKIFGCIVRCCICFSIFFWLVCISEFLVGKMFLPPAYSVLTSSEATVS